MFKIRMLPADYGDCLWIEYGKGKTIYRILIDAGTLATYDNLRSCIEEDLDERRRYFDLFIISHIDLDHIDTAVKLLNNSSMLKLKFGEIWFNGWKQLLDKDLLGPQQGEYVSALIAKKRIPLNKAFKGRAIFVPQAGGLPRIELPGDMRLTLLSPRPKELRKLRTYWKSVMKNAAGNTQAALKKLATKKKYKDVLGGPKIPNVKKLADEESQPDTAKPNGSSIVVLAEYDNKRCLFTADCHPNVLEESIDRLLSTGDSKRLELDALKVPHHGSKHNNLSSLYQKLNCRKYLISSNGNKFGHPHPECIARIIQYGGRNPHIYFNYESDYTAIWNTQAVKSKYHYNAIVRTDSQSTLNIDL
jgi:beta-lactamase superfamily II metal-dependent hydrolase